MKNNIFFNEVKDILHPFEIAETVSLAPWSFIGKAVFYPTFCIFFILGGLLKNFNIPKFIVKNMSFQYLFFLSNEANL